LYQPAERPANECKSKLTGYSKCLSPHYIVRFAGSHHQGDKEVSLSLFPQDVQIVE
jgi:hypothetical protein